MIRRGGEVAIDADPYRGGVPGSAFETGDDGVGGASPDPAGFGRGGSRPPGVYLKPESAFFLRNFSVSRLPGI